MWIKSSRIVDGEMDQDYLTPAYSKLHTKVAIFENISTVGLEIQESTEERS